MLPTTYNNDGRRVRKFISRMNAREFNAASAYIYPGDYPKLYLYLQVLSKSPNTYVKLLNKKNISLNGQKAIIAKLQCVNTSKFYENYMHGVRNMNLNDATFIDTVYIRKTRDGKCLSFDWAKIEGESLKTAQVSCNDRASAANIRADMSTNAEVIGKIQNGESVLIDDYSENTNG